ncbi:MAG: hypothetical protein KJO69_00105 [Gammaproteobacteria bacterium]|nr:hypothetical protein [Gammaproteobacteria bacterium]
MAKKRLSSLAKEYNIPYEKAEELAEKYLGEDMITGSKHLKWISEEGQLILDDIIPMPILQRGKVLKPCPNPNFVFVKHQQRMMRVAVKIPRRMIGKLVGKTIYFEERRDDNSYEVKYHWVKRIDANANI